MEIKARTRIFNVTKNDVVLFNGACWSLLTQTYYGDYSNIHPTLAKAKCEKWVKDGILVLEKEEKVYTTQEGKKMGLFYYRFTVD